MEKLKAEQIAKVKGLGFLQNRGTNLFSGRIVAPGTVFTAKNFEDMAYISNTYGNGKLICTSRLSVEIPGIAFDKIDDAVNYANECGLIFGGTGNKIRPVAACKGTTCVYGNFDTQKLAKKIHDEFYIGWHGISLPHKFKIAIGGCPNSCMKPSINDFGIEGHRVPYYNKDLCKKCKVCMVEKSCPVNAAELTDGNLKIDGELCKKCGVCIEKCPFGAMDKNSETMYQIYVGGTWGKRTRMGNALSKLVCGHEVLPILEKTLLWFKENAFAKERLGAAIDRIGIENLEKELFSDNILERKQQILDKRD